MRSCFRCVLYSGKQQILASFASKVIKAKQWPWKEQHRQNVDWKTCRSAK